MQKSNIDISYRSDHSSINLELKLAKQIHGKRLWKYNNSLLTHNEYIECVNKKIDEIKAQYCLPIYNIDNINIISNKDLQSTIRDQLF